MTLREEVLKNSGVKNEVYEVFNDDLGNVITIDGEKAVFPSKEEALDKVLKLCKDYYGEDEDYKGKKIELRPLDLHNDSELYYNIIIGDKSINTYCIITKTHNKKINSNSKLIFEIDK